MENLAKEKAELDQKLSVNETGEHRWEACSPPVGHLWHKGGVSLTCPTPNLLAEYATREEELTNTIKASYEKMLSTERTLKTQVSLHERGILFYQHSSAAKALVLGKSLHCWFMGGANHKNLLAMSSQRFAQLCLQKSEAGRHIKPAGTVSIIAPDALENASMRISRAFGVTEGLALMQF